MAQDVKVLTPNGSGGYIEAVQGRSEALWTGQTASATLTSSDITNPGYPGACIFYRVTSVPGSASATLSLAIEFKDPVGGTYAQISSRSQQISAGTAAVLIHPALGLLSASAASIGLWPFRLPQTFRVLAAVSAGATSKDVVFSVNIEWLP